MHQQLTFQVNSYQVTACWLQNETKRRVRSNHETLIQCWVDVGLASQTIGWHEPGIGSTSSVCLVAWMSIAVEELYILYNLYESRFAMSISVFFPEPYNRIIIHLNVDALKFSQSTMITKVIIKQKTYHSTDIKQRLYTTWRLFKRHNHASLIIE